MAKEQGNASTDLFDRKLQEYEKNYKIGDLNSSNDLATLHALIRAELILEQLQDRMNKIVQEEDDLVAKASDLKKLSDLTRDTIANITAMQRTLAIDRKTRREQSEQSVAEYINGLKRIAKESLDKLFIKVYCPNCKVLVNRILPVHDHTGFTVSTECSQCGKSVRVQRNAKDIFFDVRDADWRRKYPVEIIQPEKNTSSGFDLADNIDDIVDDDVEVNIFVKEPARLEQDAEITKPSPLISEDLEIDGGSNGTN